MGTYNNSSALHLALTAILGSCAHTDGQTAFGVSAELTQAVVNSECAVMQVEIHNSSAQSAFILMHSSYPTVSMIASELALRVSFHEFSRIWIPGVHDRPHTLHRIPPRGRVFMRVTLPLPLQTQEKDYYGPAENVVLPILVRIAVGVVNQQGHAPSDGGGILFSQRIAETGDLPLGKAIDPSMRCPERGVTLSRKSPAGGIKNDDIIFKIDRVISPNRCLDGDKNVCEYEKKQDNYIRDVLQSDRRVRPTR